ncbi:MAG: zinc-ribbon domain-containing protein [Planctomycetes bacterium]|nr:zinc-ribbon domain-containing protein [Planctomycetota bacterium]MCB9902800.1 zinc-ribbon domain-containing protein [Planctomycetota bacterium]
MPHLVCPHCGAAVKHTSARFCEYCGAEIPRAVDELPRSPDEQRTGRLERLEAHPQFQAMLRAALEEEPEPLARTHGSGPLLPPARRGPTRNTVIGVGALSLIMLVAFARGDLSVNTFVMFVLGGFAAVLLAVFSALRGLPPIPRKVEARPVRRKLLPRAAAIVDERSEVTGKAGLSDVSTRYFLTLEFIDGARAEYRVDARFAAHCTSGDVGAAIIERGSLRSFHRIKI